MPQNRSFKPRRPIGKPTGGNKSVEEIIRELKAAGQNTNANYRQQSLQIHGLICAKCGREFDEKNKNLLTVHHKDGNHNNNPADGSNWENLCAYCHDDEHTRGLLGDYIAGK
ncbi:YajD family HNH nuclease [Candidatus Magnetominusculus dajiuhuensis]|uniref:YajD family HNH nuclease n=1 Tax=Candidatus Magnetominusculus dajiuhuensis TaxID=3137712 RepID=UPI003B43A772